MLQYFCIYLLHNFMINSSIASLFVYFWANPLLHPLFHPLNKINDQQFILKTSPPIMLYVLSYLCASWITFPFVYFMANFLSCPSHCWDPWAIQTKILSNCVVGMYFFVFMLLPTHSLSKHVIFLLICLLHECLSFILHLFTY